MFGSDLWPRSEKAKVRGLLVLSALLELTIGALSKLVLETLRDGPIQHW